jgi:hypothetical protein
VATALAVYQTLIATALRHRGGPVRSLVLRYLLIAIPGSCCILVLCVVLPAGILDGYRRWIALMLIALIVWVQARMLAMTGVKRR